MTEIKLNILMCCHLPLNPALGGAKVYIEAAEVYRLYGHNVKLVGIDDIVKPDKHFMDESWRVKNFPNYLKQYILKNAEGFDVIEFEAIYLPYDMKKEVQGLLVARSVLLDLHLTRIKIPRFSGLKSLLGSVFKTWSRRKKLNEKIAQSLTTMKYADFVNVPNQSDKHELVINGIEESKIIVQPYGIFKQRAEDFKKKQVIAAKSNRVKKIAFVGTFDNRKGAVEFPQIMKNVLSVYSNIEFKLLGVLGMFSSEESIYNYLGPEYSSKTKIVPKFAPEDLPELLKDCSIGIFPSYLESFGFGVLEMMAMGMPVVGYNSPGINMLIPEDLLVPPGDVAGLCELISKLIKDEKKYKDALNECNVKVENFTYENQKNLSLSTYLKNLQER